MMSQGGVAREYLKNWCEPSAKIDFVWFAVEIFFSCWRKIGKKGGHTALGVLSHISPIGMCCPKG